MKRQEASKLAETALAVDVSGGGGVEPTNVTVVESALLRGVVA
jgi:hypothetical protein